MKKACSFGYVPLILIIVIIVKNTQAQTDTLYSPYMYSVVPKIVDYNTLFSSPYSLKLNNGKNTYKYSNENIQNLNIVLPLINNKKGWYLNATFKYYWFNRQINDSSNYAVFYQNSIRVMKKTHLLNRDWHLNATFLFNGNDLLDPHKIGAAVSATTPIGLRNGKIIVGATGIIMPGVIIPVLPVINYAGWLNKQQRILFEIRVPVFELKVGKIFTNTSRLKAGILVHNLTNYTSNSYYQFLNRQGSYELNRLMSNVFVEYEKTVFKDFWINIKPGYALNIYTNIKQVKNNRAEEKEILPYNNAFIKVGVFYRPSKFKR